MHRAFGLAAQHWDPREQVRPQATVPRCAVLSAIGRARRAPGSHALRTTPLGRLSALQLRQSRDIKEQIRQYLSEPFCSNCVVPAGILSRHSKARHGRQACSLFVSRKVGFINSFACPVGLTAALGRPPPTLSRPTRSSHKAFKFLAPRLRGHAATRASTSLYRGIITRSITSPLCAMAK